MNSNKKNQKYGGALFLPLVFELFGRQLIGTYIEEERLKSSNCPFLVFCLTGKEVSQQHCRKKIHYFFFNSSAHVLFPANRFDRNFEPHQIDEVLNQESTHCS